MIGYYLQLCAYTLLLYGVYALLLKRQPYAQVSRVFLWLTITLPFVLPLLKFSWPQPVAKLAPAPLMQYLPEVTFQTGRANAGFNWPVILFALYAAVALFLLLKNAVQWRRFRRQLARAEQIVFEGIEVAILPHQGPGSFGRFIFFPTKEIAPAILRHEQAHVAQRHYVDLLILRFLRVVCWPHFLLYFLEKELRLVHEYAADRAAVQQDATGYAQLLLQQTFNVKQPLIHTFFHHPLKQRIMMLQKETKVKAGRSLGRKAAVSVLLLSGLILFSQCQKGEEKTSQQTGSGATVQAYKFVDEMPEFNGDYSEYLGKKLRYPEAAREQHLEGRAIIQFIVDKDGSVRDATVVKSSGAPVLDEEALRVVREMPAWQPGKQSGVTVPVYFTLPITFQLE